MYSLAIVLFEVFERV